MGCLVPSKAKKMQCDVSSSTDSGAGGSPWECLGSRLQRRVVLEFFSSHLGILSVFLLSSCDKQLSCPVPGGKDRAVLPTLPARTGPNSQDVITPLLGFKVNSWHSCGDRPALPAIGQPGAGLPPLPHLCAAISSCLRQVLGLPTADGDQNGLVGRWCHTLPPSHHKR